MPDVTDQICNLLNLQAGDLIVTEAPFEDCEESELKPINSSKALGSFQATHISIFTGDFIEPFAHSVKEGFKLPGVRLTGAWEGRHIIYRFNDVELASRFAEIARRWALSSTMYDLEKFNKVYPRKFWEDKVDVYKKQFFSIPNATVSGPATPYDLERESQQLYNRMRNPSLKAFRPESMLRAVKFASRSELFKPISRGLRCTSFVVSAIQAATLAPIVNKCDIKFSFKPFKSINLEDLKKALLVKGWDQTEIGIKLKASLEGNDFRSFFPECFALDSKYAIPSDIFNLLKSAKDWAYIGSYVCFNDELLYCNKQHAGQSTLLFSKKPLIKKSLQSHNPIKPPLKNTVRHKLNFSSKYMDGRAIKKNYERESNILLQLEQEKSTNRKLSIFATPPRIVGPGSQRLGAQTMVNVEDLESPRTVARKLNFDI